MMNKVIFKVIAKIGWRKVYLDAYFREQTLISSIGGTRSLSALTNATMPVASITQSSTIPIEIFTSVFFSSVS